MTPLALELRGFTCFREATRIDLSELSLFAICGPTGAGKSTILDAVTYALYGQTARLGKQNLDALISPGEAQLAVTLSFETPQGTFRVVRTADRKPAGRVERNTRILQLAPDASWQQLPESEKLREADTRLEAIVGLDYDGFTRSVLLPQGAFDEFLRGDPGKRRKLLAALLGLDRLEAMQKAAGQRARAADEEARHLRERLEQDYAGVSPERKRDLACALSAKQAEERSVSAQAREAAEALRALDEVKALLREQAEIRRTLAQLGAEAPLVQTKRERLKAAQQAAPVAPLLEALERARSRAERAQATLSEARSQQHAAQTRCAEAEARSAQAQAEAEGALPELSRQLEGLAGLEPLVRTLKARGGKLEDAKRADPDTAYSDDAWDEAQRQSALVPGLKQAHRAAAQAEQRAREAERTLAELTRERSTLTQDLNEVTLRGKAVKEDLAQAKAAYERAALADQAAALRAHLHAGDPCPVCAQVIETLPPDEAGDLPALTAQVAEAEAERAGLLERYHGVRAQLDSMQSRLADREAALAQAQEQQAQAAAALLEQTLSFAGFGSADADALEHLLGTRRQRLLAALAQTISAQSGGLDPEVARARLSAEKGRLERSLADAQAQRQHAQAVLAQSAALVTERAGAAQQAREEHAEAGEAARQALSGAGFADADAARAALLETHVRDALETAVQGFERRKESAESRDVALSAKIKGRVLDDADYARAQDAAKQLGAQQDELNQAIGALRRELSDLSEKLARAEELRSALQAATATFETYRQLNSDLKGNEFQSFLLTRVQAELAQRASHTIRAVTAGRYDLRLEDNDYQVSDAWNGGERRNARTLSGGETFIASLALALALSETIAGRALGALFLDEGFGTLDPDTLEAVTLVLESLTAQGRMVGVITHVQALTERLPARLTVSKGPSGSSVSWDLSE